MRDRVNLALRGNLRRKINLAYLDLDTSMSGHGDNIKLLIKLNWAFAGIFIIGFMALYYTIIQDTKQYVAYEREQLKNMIITEQMDRADFKKQMDDYMANHKMKYYAKIDNLVPSAFKGYSTKKSK